MMDDDEELSRKLKPALARGPAFLPDERDLLARIALGEKAKSPFWGLTAAASGLAAALALVLAIPGSAPVLEAQNLEDAIIEDFGSALTGAATLEWEGTLVATEEDASSSAEEQSGEGPGRGTSSFVLPLKGGGNDWV